MVDELQGYRFAENRFPAIHGSTALHDQIFDTEEKGFHDRRQPQRTNRQIGLEGGFISS